MGSHGQRWLIFHRDASASVQIVTIHQHRAADDLQPSSAAGRYFVRDLLAGVEQSCEELRVLMDHNGTIVPI